MPSHRGAWWWLLEKEWRELLASRAWWIMLLLMGPLVGFAFISAVRTYAEASGLNGTAIGVGEAFSPLIGIWAPTFSACELAAVFLLPFVGIRLVAGDRQSGALKLELQHAMPAALRVTAKALVLVAGWVVASIPVAVAVILWRSYGGSIFVPELATVAAGHLMNALLTIGLAAAAASMTEHPSTAAILTLSVTVGTWILNFIAAVQGGIWEQIAGYTPTAMVSEFQHGLIRVDVVIAASTLIVAGLALAAVWMRLAVAHQRRVAESMAVLAIATSVIAFGALVHTSWDTSESRWNSFSRSDEATLGAIDGPISIEVHLAPEDPRRVDFERQALSKLRRVRPDAHVRFTSATSIGLFEQTSPHYGEVWYEIDGRRTMSRATTAEAALESIYEAAGIPPPAEEENGVFRGHPLAVPPKGAATVFYGIWPAAVLAGAFVVHRRQV